MHRDAKALPRRIAREIGSHYRKTCDADIRERCHVIFPCLEQICRSMRNFAKLLTASSSIQAKISPQLKERGSL